ncbi:HD domain-containing protein [Falsibacillus albus]|nr:HD domain-containing protein [Falsibacillus albus]
MNIIERTEEFVRLKLGHDTSGHDWHHVDRVRKMALYIAEKERKGDLFIIEMAALLHDIADDKLYENPEDGYKILLDWLESCRLNRQQMESILSIINTISFKGGNEAELNHIEAQIVRDADRLDALGAIGIARTFAYGGKKGAPLYDPSLPVRKDMTVEEYRNGKSSSIHHFYEKLLLLKDKMHTKTAKELAQKRHHVMEDFLKQFYTEWNGSE